MIAEGFPVGKKGWSVGNDENSKDWVTPQLFLGLGGGKEKRKEEAVKRGRKERKNN